MKQLEVKTIKSEPAKIVFNYEEIEKRLDESLKKYSGLTFTEEDASECKSTIAELRKAKKAVDQYRLKTKKELSAPITEFENSCKMLNKKFDEVINPLVEQHDSFEEKRKAEKREQIHEVIAQLIEDYDLYAKYASELVVTDNHLTKSKSMKAIKEELTTNADHLKMKQDKEESDKEIIKSTVEFINERYGITLSESAYERLLDYKDIKEIKQQILDDGQKAAEKKIEKVEVAEEVAPPKEELPFEDIPEPPIEDETTVYEVYKVTGTESQLDALEEFMRTNNITWEVVTDE